MSLEFSELLKKYDVQVPRYTSYPTVPSWTRTPQQDEWIADIKHTLNSDQSSWSMYIHLPFCETLCTFCGCNTIITKDHKKEIEYVDLLISEFNLYLEKVPELATKPLKMIHLGGGTPTFLSVAQLQKLINTLFQKITKDQKDFEASIEIDPRRTTYEQLKALKEMGFNRVSLGVQDFNEKVQLLINRVQPFEITKNITDLSRELGYESVNFDLIYGLPAQDLQMIQQTIEKTIELKPDRIAFYSFALVPWIKPAQRLFSDSDLPDSETKRQLYEVAREMFLKAGYIDIGMDHFALKSDQLYAARENKKLHRNFMGYTDKKTDLLLGLGISSISESKTMFHQNEKLLPKYLLQLQQNQLATHRGHILTEVDQKNRSLILRLMTQFELNIESQEQFDFIQTRTKEFLNEGLIELTEQKIKVTALGRPFLRNICSIFDEYLVKKSDQLYSKSI